MLSSLWSWCGGFCEWWVVFLVLVVVHGVMWVPLSAWVVPFAIGCGLSSVP